MKNIVALLTLVFGVVFLTSALKTPTSSGYEDVTGDFKNLKVLPQTISKDSLMDLMKGYNEALGVKCNFCHSRDKSADDVHTKDIARHMITFTNELNTKEFNPIGKEYENAVSCMMCHRGSNKPLLDLKSGSNKKGNK